MTTSPTTLIKRPKTHFMMWTILGIFNGILFGYLIVKLGTLLGANFFTLGSIFNTYFYCIIIVAIPFSAIGLYRRMNKLNKYNKKVKEQNK